MRTHAHYTRYAQKPLVGVVVIGSYWRAKLTGAAAADANSGIAVRVGATRPCTAPVPDQSVTHGSFGARTRFASEFLHVRRRSLVLGRARLPTGWLAGWLAWLALKLGSMLAPRHRPSLHHTRL